MSEVTWDTVEGLNKRIVLLEKQVEALLDHKHCPRCNRPCGEFGVGPGGDCIRCQGRDAQIEAHGKASPEEWP